MTLLQRGVGGLAHPQPELCLLTASKRSELTDWQPQAPGKAAERWFFRIHYHHEQVFVGGER